jgi:hypothetical protein
LNNANSVVALWQECSAAGACTNAPAQAWHTIKASLDHGNSVAAAMLGTSSLHYYNLLTQPTKLACC